MSAQILQVGNMVKPIQITTQHEKKITLLQNGIWVITWDKESTRVANTYFEKFGIKDNIQMIVDVSQIPSGILNLFVLPRMRDYKHEILLSHDEVYNLTLPYEENAITVMRVQDMNVERIDFAKTQEELKALLP